MSHRTPLLAALVGLLIPLSACASVGSLASELGLPNPENAFSLAAASAVAASAQNLLDGGTPHAEVLAAAELAAYEIEYPEIVSGLETAPAPGGLLVTTVFKDPVTGDEVTGHAYVCLGESEVRAQEQPCR